MEYIIKRKFRPHIRSLSLNNIFVNFHLTNLENCDMLKMVKMME